MEEGWWEVFGESCGVLVIEMRMERIGRLTALRIGWEAGRHIE